MKNTQRLRKIPSVSESLETLRREPWFGDYSREQLLRIVREEFSGLRIRLRNSDERAPTWEELAERIHRHLQEVHAFSLKRVINATGVIVHTNLGRAPLAEEALAHLSEIAGGYSNLEFDLTEGERGSREKHVENLVLHLLPAEASVVVNNNAAALLLILNTFAEGKEAIVSRGELVEIGGSFRLPEIMKKSGAILREIGTTNKTRLEDYRKAAGKKTGMILVVHPSNFQIVGFTEKPSLQEVVELGKERRIPVIEDHGSGILLDLEEFGIPGEATVADRLQEGIDLICFSGDKILGGPQAGIICGKKTHVDELRKNPLFRALRVDKMTYAALEATLLLYLKNQASRVPVVRLLSQSTEDLRTRGLAWLSELQRRFPEASWSLESTTNYIGGGVAPMKELPSFAVALRDAKLSSQKIAHRLRQSDPPVIARIEEDRVFLELRTISIVEQGIVVSALEKILLE